MHEVLDILNPQGVGKYNFPLLTSTLQPVPYPDIHETSIQEMAILFLLCEYIFSLMKFTVNNRASTVAIL